MAKLMAKDYTETLLKQEIVLMVLLQHIAGPHPDD